MVASLHTYRKKGGKKEKKQPKIAFIVLLWHFIVISHDLVINNCFLGGLKMLYDLCLFHVAKSLRQPGKNS
jgi:hypothetical protein